MESMEMSLREFYTQNYQDDEMGTEIYSENTFSDLYTVLIMGLDVYSLIGVSDSIIRERLFAGLADIKNVPYSEIYELWLNPSISNELLSLN
jgi:hypothetical protein